MSEANRADDFRTGENVLRFQYRVPSKPCAGCGTHTVNYDAKWGWHICTDCNSEDVAAEIADHVTNPNRGLNGLY